MTRTSLIVSQALRGANVVDLGFTYPHVAKTLAADKTWHYYGCPNIILAKSFDGRTFGLGLRGDASTTSQQQHKRGQPSHFTSIHHHRPPPTTVVL